MTEPQIDASTLPAGSSPSVNGLSQGPLRQLLARARDWQVRLDTGPLGVTVIDAGITVPGSIDAGLAIAEICLGGLGRVVLSHVGAGDGWPLQIEVSSPRPVLACLASQYAGWSLSATREEAGGRKFFSLGSGPARALAGRETLFEQLGYGETPAVLEASRGSACLVLETDRVPPEIVVRKVLDDCGLDPWQLTLILTPTTSAAGTTQVVARVLEVALHKAHVRDFPLDQILAGSGAAPLPLPSPDGGQAMGRTNDAILYGGSVHLVVGAGDEDARALANALPSRRSKDYGRPFADIFREYDYDFYRIDPELFAPAECWVTSTVSGQTWHAGARDLDLLRRQWMREA